MSKTVFIEQTKGGFIVDRCAYPKSKTVHTDLPCALAAVSDLLQPPDDKPDLDPQHKEILQSLIDEKGCVFRLNHKWRFAPIGESGQNLMGTAITCNSDIYKMLDLGLLESESPVNTVGGSGMELYAYVTKAGVEALKR